MSLKTATLLHSLTSPFDILKRKKKKKGKDLFLQVQNSTADKSSQAIKLNFIYRQI